MAMLFITHDLGIVRKIADDVCVMQKGRIVESGPVAEVFSHPQHVYTKALLAAEPNLRLVLKEFPLLGPESSVAARASIAVWQHQPAKFAAFHDAMMRSTARLDENGVLRIARETGVDADGLMLDMADPRIDRLRAQMVVREDKTYTRDYDGPRQSNHNAVQVFFKDGSHTPKVDVEFLIGDARRRKEAMPLLERKFRDHTEAVAIRLDTERNRIGLRRGTSHAFSFPQDSVDFARHLGLRFHIAGPHDNKMVDRHHMMLCVPALGLSLGIAKQGFRTRIVGRLADNGVKLAIEQREFRDQMLDSMDIERERGITIKAQTVRLNYPAQDGKTYVLNLMDTPGHVDFAYEVSRSLAACEGSLLVVDASQGVEAQTLANAYHAIDANHEIIPVLNKIDLPSAEPERVCKEIEDVVGIDTSEAIKVSAKTGVGIDDLLEAMVKRLPPPKGDRNAPLKALLVDSWYDPYLGVVILVRVIDGTLKKGQQVKFMQSGTMHLVDRVGAFRPKIEQFSELGPGEIGFITAQIKQVADTRVGDTITETKRPCAQALEGFKPAQPVVFCGLFPVDAAQFEDLRSAMGKLRLNDASFSFEMETSAALGFGFRCGFLGLLHLEIIQERLSREFNLDLIATAPSVIYKMHLQDGTTIEIQDDGTISIACAFGTVCTVTSSGSVSGPVEVSAGSILGA